MQINLTWQDRDYLTRVVATEVDHRLAQTDADQYRSQIAGVVDTILNRVASPSYPDTVKDVVDQWAQFSAVNGPERDYTVWKGVENIPDSVVPAGLPDVVNGWVNNRINGARSSVGGHLNYANIAESEGQEWLDSLTGPAFGRGGSVHNHGTDKWAKQTEAAVVGDMYAGDGTKLPPGEIPEVMTIVDLNGPGRQVANRVDAMWDKMPPAPQPRSAGMAARTTAALGLNRPRPADMTTGVASKRAAYATNRYFDQPRPETPSDAINARRNGMVVEAAPTAPVTPSGKRLLPTIGPTGTIQQDDVGTMPSAIEVKRLAAGIKTLSKPAPSTQGGMIERSGPMPQREPLTPSQAQGGTARSPRVEEARRAQIADNPSYAGAERGQPVDRAQLERRAKLTERQSYAGEERGKPITLRPTVSASDKARGNTPPASKQPVEPAGKAATQPAAADLDLLDRNEVTPQLTRSGTGVTDVAQIALYGNKPAYKEIGEPPAQPAKTATGGKQPATKTATREALTPSQAQTRSNKPIVAPRSVTNKPTKADTGQDRPPMQRPVKQPVSTKPAAPAAATTLSTKPVTSKPTREDTGQGKPAKPGVVRTAGGLAGSVPMAPGSRPAIADQLIEQAKTATPTTATTAGTKPAATKPVVSNKPTREDTGQSPRPAAPKPATPKPNVPLGLTPSQAQPVAGQYPNKIPSVAAAETKQPKPAAVSASDKARAAGNKPAAPKPAAPAQSAAEIPKYVTTTEKKPRPPAEPHKVGSKPPAGSFSYSGSRDSKAAADAGLKRAEAGGFTTVTKTTLNPAWVEQQKKAAEPAKPAGKPAAPAAAPPAKAPTKIAVAEPGKPTAPKTTTTKPAEKRTPGNLLERVRTAVGLPEGGLGGGLLDGFRDALGIPDGGFGAGIGRGIQRAFGLEQGPRLPPGTKLGKAANGGEYIQGHNGIKNSTTQNSQAWRAATGDSSAENYRSGGDHDKNGAADGGDVRGIDENDPRFNGRGAGKTTRSGGQVRFY